MASDIVSLAPCSPSCFVVHLSLFLPPSVLKLPGGYFLPPQFVWWGTWHFIPLIYVRTSEIYRSDKKEMKEAMARPSGIFLLKCDIIYLSRSELIFFTARLFLQYFWADWQGLGLGLGSFRKHVATSPGWPIRFGLVISGRRCSRSALGGRLAMTLVATISTVMSVFSFCQNPNQTSTQPNLT